MTQSRRTWGSSQVPQYAYIEYSLGYRLSHHFSSINQSEISNTIHSLSLYWGCAGPPSLRIECVYVTVWTSQIIMGFTYCYMSGPADLESHLPAGGVGSFPEKVDSSLYRSWGSAWWTPHVEKWTRMAEDVGSGAFLRVKEDTAPGWPD